MSAFVTSYNPNAGSYGFDRQPVSEERLEAFKADLRRDTEVMLPIWNESLKVIRECDKEIAEAQAMKVQARQQRAEAEAKLVEVAKSREAIAKKEEVIDKKKEAIAKKEEALAQLKKDSIIRQFWSIFNGKAILPQENYGEVFNTYLANRSITVEKNAEGKTCFRINSMNSVVKYLQDNPLTKMCDFRAFKNEINDVDTFTDFIQTPAAYAIKALAFKTDISEIVKAKLAEVVAVRASTSSPLKVQYFA